MTFWEQLAVRLEAKNKLALLYVISSEGSSPGRQGFNMAVTEDGEMFGSIGGGFMEQKLVDLARSKMKDHSTSPFIMQQIHRKDVSTNQSGMICSGEQTVAFYFLGPEDLLWLRQVSDCLENESTGILLLNPRGIEFTLPEIMDKQYSVSIQSNNEWVYREQIGNRNTIFIVGGGHVGTALSEIMARLGFYVRQIDNREGLNTMINNPFAHKKQVVDYNKIDAYIPEGNGTFIALVSFGYRTDKLLLKKLLGKNYRYLGMLGSEEKVRILFDELVAEGIERQLLNKVHAPLGLPIHSKTPNEIAISVAAEIISIKNLKR